MKTVDALLQLIEILNKDLTELRANLHATLHRLQMFDKRTELSEIEIGDDVWLFGQTWEISARDRAREEITLHQRGIIIKVL